jgi:sterol desaturase/sphingolipid hydroxylase (fatty acid hydroxylase superfamily)
VALRVAVPVLAVGAAGFAQRLDVGLLNLWDPAPWLAFVIALVVLDLVIYAQHVVVHHVPLLWRIHRVHHADRDIDASTALRFHPVEIILSMGIKIAVVMALGAPPAAVIAFEIILNGMAMFNHANLRLPGALDGLLRLAVVTPDMHRVHHSVHMRETNSNFGFNLSLWDRLFGTYRAAPEDGHDRMTIGLAEYQDDRPSQLGFALWLPFTKGR